MIMLKGKKSICAFVGRSGKVLMRWITEEKFPAIKIDDVWQSDEDLIREWLRKKIQGEVVQ